MTLKGGSSGACAACKYRRRRCARDCQLAPYFPADKPKTFQNAHRLFGVSNIVKLLDTLPESKKPDAMSSIIFQSWARARFPVKGCLGIIQDLHYMVWVAEEELKLVNSQLELLRSNNNNNTQMNPNQVLDLEMAPPLGSNNGNATTSAFNPMQTQVSYSYSCSDVNCFGSVHTDSKDNMGNNKFVSTHCMQHPDSAFQNYKDVMNEDDVVAFQNSLPLVVQPETVQDYDEIQPLFDALGDRQSYIDSKVACKSSSEDSVKDGQRTCFKLTNVS